MRPALFVVLLVASLARADIPPPEPASPPDTSCVGKAEGASCNDGGTCRSVKVRRPVLQSGATTPTWTWAEVMVCEKPAPSSSARWVVAFVLLVLSLSLRKRGEGRGEGLLHPRPQ